MDAITNNLFTILGLAPTSSYTEFLLSISKLSKQVAHKKKQKFYNLYNFFGKKDIRNIDSNDILHQLNDPYLKLFNSIMYLDNDIITKDAFKFFKQNKFEKGVNILENAIYENSEIIYNTSKVIDPIEKNLKNIVNEKYEIRVLNRKDSFLKLRSSIFGQEFILQTFQNTNDYFQITETNADISAYDKFEVNCSFNWLSKALKPVRKLAFCFYDEEMNKHIYSISPNGIFEHFVYRDKLIDKYNNSIERKFDNSSVNENISFAVKIINNKIEIILNGKALVKFDLFKKFHKFSLLLFNNQILKIKSFNIYTLDHTKNYSNDIILNNNNFIYVKNLALIYLLQVFKKGSLKNNYFLNFCKLFSTLFNQDYLIEYSKIINGKNFTLNYSNLLKILIDKLFISLKDFIFSESKTYELYFYSPLRYLSSEAENLAKEKVLTPRIKSFENIIKESKNISEIEPLKSYVIFRDLYREANVFFEWYSQFYGYGNDHYVSMSNRIANDLLECSILFYETNENKNKKLAIQTLELIKNASNYAINQELRDKINEFILRISNAHNLGLNEINFKIVDIDKFLESISYKGE